jgi:hypothetical protein
LANIAVSEEPWTGGAAAILELLCIAGWCSLPVEALPVIPVAPEGNVLVCREKSAWFLSADVLRKALAAEWNSGR